MWWYKGLDHAAAEWVRISNSKVWPVLTGVKLGVSLVNIVSKLDVSSKLSTAGM